MDDAFGVTKVEGIGNGEDDFCYLRFCGAAMEVVGGVEFAALAVLHDYIEEARVVIDLVDLDDVGVLQLYG